MGKLVRDKIRRCLTVKEKSSTQEVYKVCRSQNKKEKKKNQNSILNHPSLPKLYKIKERLGNPMIYQALRIMLSKGSFISRGKHSTP